MKREQLIKKLRILTLSDYNPDSMEKIYSHLPENYVKRYGKEKTFEYIMELIHDFFMDLPEKIKHQNID